MKEVVTVVPPIQVYCAPCRGLFVPHHNLLACMLPISGGSDSSNPKGDTRPVMAN